MRPRAYTVVEAMAALAILAVGAAGVIAMQRSVVAGGAHSRNLAVATAVAMTWAERVRVDALQWNDPGGVSDLGGTAWLDVSESRPGVTVLPAEKAGLGAPAADLAGVDLFSGDPAAPAFCTHLRFMRRDPAWPALMRVEVRVFWDRGGSVIDCSVDPDDVDAGQQRYGAVHIATSVLRSANQD